MELLILLLLTPAILAQRYGKNSDPNDEPFLPIYPVYPYSPKLIKRGVERESLSQLSPELYAPKVDAKESYSLFNTNYPRDPYYPNYNPYPKASPSPPTYASYYNSAPYSYTSTPYSAYNSYSSPYTSSPYSANPYSTTNYPNYYYQPPYYYPHYYNQPLFPPPPPPPAGADDSKDSYSDSEPDTKSKEKKPDDNEKLKDNELNAESAGSQFVDGANYISGNSRDLDGQSSTYKAASPYNQLEQVSDAHIKNLPIPLPKTTYRVISVAGQPVAPDYPLPAPYLKAQQLEQLMTQALAKLLEQNTQQQVAQYSVYEPNQNAATKPNDASQLNQNNYNKDAQGFLSIPNIFAKTGLAYVINPGVLGKLNVGQKNSQILQVPTQLTKALKYSPLTRLTLEQSPGMYAPPEKSEKEQTSVQSNDYDNYENQPSQVPQNYENPLSQSDTRQEPNYANEQGQSVSYQNQNFVTVQTPQPPSLYTYQYTNYNPSQAPSQQQSQQYKTNLEDVNFGAKQNNKG